MRINATLASVQSAKPAYAYGQLARVPLKSGEKAGVLRAAIPADIPDDAIITKADLVFHTRESWSGSIIFSAQRQSEAWSVSKVTWNNRPDVLAGTSKQTTVTSPVLGQEFRIDVSDHAQAFVSGTATNRGWRIYNDAGTARDIYGATAAKHKPYLDLTYVVPDDAPTGLVPDGAAVSTAKPTLTFAVPDDTAAIQVQIDATADAVSPDWDSGQINTPAGLLDLTTTTYPGLADGATTYWRCRSKGPLGWSLFSSWATMPRVSKPTVTITAPAPTTGDKTPPIAWTAPGSVMWQARLLRTSGEVLDESDITASADLEWTAGKGLRKIGDTGRAHVRVWDGVDRVATPGDPTWSEAFLDFALVAIDVAPGADTVQVSQVGPSPVVRVTWTGPLPDLWRITRDGDLLDLVDGSETTYLDYGAAPLTQHVYQALVATGTGEVSPNGPTATLRTRPAGAWLMDPDTGEQLFFLDEEVATTMAERAVLHTPLGDAPLVRRRSGTPPPSGTASGLLLESAAGDDYLPADMAATAFRFKNSDQGHVYRLAWGSWNIPVTIGDMNVAPVTLDDTARPAFSIDFSWWQTSDELPWED